MIRRIYIYSSLSNGRACRIKCGACDWSDKSFASSARMVANRHNEKCHESRLEIKEVI